MEKTLRFCMVTTFYPPYHFGGDAVFTYRLSNELARRGHHVEVIHCRDAYSLLHPAEPEGAYPHPPNVTVHSLKSKAGILSPLLTQQTGYPALKSKKIRQILEEGRFDVIHFHNVSLVGGPNVLAYGDAVKLYTLHEYWLVCPMHILFKFNREACTKPSCLRCTLIHKRPPQLWRYTGMLEHAVRHVDAFIAPSKFTAEMHHRRGLQIPTVHIPMFIPEPPLPNPGHAQEVPNGGRPYFLFVGRLEKLKGLQEVIPLFARYTEADLLIAGTGTYQKALEDIAAGNARVKFLGRLPYDALQALYRNAVALLVPSLCYETFGLIILEAFSTKTPVIARNIGALGELVEESEGGYLFRNDAELLAAMERLRTDPELRAERGERGYATYLAQGTTDSFLQRYLALVEELRERRAMA